MDAAVPSSTPALLGGGELGALIRAHDWSATPLGPPERWPASLRTAVSLMLGAPQPVHVAWGPQLTSLYNDAYTALLGPRHPEGLGLPSEMLWRDLWDEFGPVVEAVMRGEVRSMRDRAVPVDGRHKPPSWFTLTWTPLRDDDGAVAGFYCAVAETTGHVLAERRREEERDRHRLMLQQMPGFVALLTGPEHRFDYVNDAYREVAGERDYIGRPAREVFADLPDTSFLDRVDEAYATGSPVAVAALPVRMADRERFLDLRYEPVRDDDGRVSGVFIGGYDVTERVRAVARLVRSEADLRIALQAGRLGAWSLELATGEMATSETCRTNFGRAPDDAFSYADLRDSVHPDDRSRMAAMVERSLATGEDYDIEHRIVTPAGETRWIHVRGQPHAAGTGTPERMSGVSLDITARREAEAALHETAERLGLAVENAEIGFWDVDPVHDVLVWPPRTKAMFGISPDVPVTMRDFYQGLHPDDREATGAAFAAAADPDRRALYDVEYRTVGKEDGVVRWVAAKGRGIFDETGRCVRVLGTAIDVSYRKDAEARLRELNETLEARVLQRTSELEAAHEQLRQSQKLEAMGSLTGGVAHDFNNLLTPIVGALDMLARRGVGGEREQRLIAGAAQSADRARTLVQRLLAFARRQPLQPTPVSLGPLVRNMADLVASTTGPQIRVEVEAADDLPAALADPNQVEMALLNLSVNARDAMPRGGLLRIHVDARAVEDDAAGLPPGRYLRLSVTDTGAGMDEATLARAVEPFFSTKGVGRGTGLGLSMVHGLASQLGGALVLDSRPGEGTTAALWLPQTCAPAEAPARAPEPAPVQGRGVALLVDDEAFVRLSTADMLTELGFQVVEAACAEQALELVDAGRPVDVVVTDHLMPGMTGAELARAVRARRPGLPVLLVSGYAEVESVSADLPRLAKPFRKDELAASLAELPAAPVPGSA